MVNVPKIFLLYVILTLLPIATSIHETGHLLACEYLGIEGVIESSNINRVVLASFPESDFDILLLYMSGGLYQCLVFFGISLFMDKNSGLAFKMIAIEGLITAICEPNKLLRMTRYHYIIGVLSALAYLLYIFIQDNKRSRLNDQV